MTENQQAAVLFPHSLLSGFGSVPPALLVPSFDIQARSVTFSGIGDDLVIAESNVNRFAVTVWNDTSGLLFIGTGPTLNNGRRNFILAANEQLTIAFYTFGALVGRELRAITLAGSGDCHVTEILYSPRC